MLHLFASPISISPDREKNAVECCHIHLLSLSGGRSSHCYVFRLVQMLLLPFRVKKKSWPHRVLLVLCRKAAAAWIFLRSCCSLQVPPATHRGNRWQPNIPLPPQLCCGVSCISNLCSPPPIAAGRMILTIIALPSLCCTVCATLVNLS